MTDKHMALIGTGSIGLMLGAFLARGGYDVTMVSQFRPQMAQLLNEKGIRVTFGAEEWTQPVHSVFWEDLGKEEQFDILFLTGKSNDTQDAMEKMLPHLAPDGFVTSLQNGINDDVIAGYAGQERVIPCICFAGGQCPEPNHIMTHDGYFIIGEPDGSFTPRLLELQQILSCVKEVEVTDDIRAARWKKLSEVCLTVPVATVSGYPLFAGYEDTLIQRVFGKLAGEVMAVEAACGTEPEPIMGLTRSEWDRLSREDAPELTEKFLAVMRRPFPPQEEGETPPAAMSPSDAYTNDIRRHRPLEVWYTNGYVRKRAGELGIPVPVNDRLCDMIREIEAGTRKACRENLSELILVGE